MNEIIVYNMTGRKVKFPTFFDEFPKEIQFKILNNLFKYII